MEWKSPWILVLLAVCVWTASLSILLSQARGETAKGKTKSSVAAAKNTKAPKRLLHMEEVEIYGEVEKPKTMFVIPRARLRYSRKDRSKDFTEEILGPVNNRWIEDTQRWRTGGPDQ